MVWLPKTQGSRPVLFYAAPSGARWESQGFWANWAKANWANSLLHCLFGTFTELHTENKDEKIHQKFGSFKILLYFCRKSKQYG